MSVYDTALAQLEQDWPAATYPAMNTWGRHLIESAREAGEPVPGTVTKVLAVGEPESATSTKAPAPSTPSKFAQTIRAKAAGLIATGQKVEDAEVNALRSYLYEFPDTKIVEAEFESLSAVAQDAYMKARQAASDGQSIEYFEDGGPETPAMKLARHKRGELTEDEAADILTKADARHEQSKRERERAPFMEQRAADLQRYVERGHTMEEAEAKFPWSDYTAAPARVRSTQPLIDQMKALDPSAMGLVGQDA